MKIAGTVPVEVPECEICSCNSKCPLGILADEGYRKCELEVMITKWRWFDLSIPGPTCPAHDTVPNPWADVPGYEDRPEAEWRGHKAVLDKAWEGKPIGPCPECGRDAWMNKWNIWHCDACGKACP